MKILLIILIIIALILIIALFIKKEYSLQREIIIDQPLPPVFNYVSLLKNQDYFSKWVMMEPDMKKEFRGTDGTVGFVYAWEGKKKAGKGEQEIKSVTPNVQIEMELRFEKPIKAISQVYMITTRVDENKTKVTWRLDGVYPYPFNLMKYISQNILGKDMQISLDLLKTILEKK